MANESNGYDESDYMSDAILGIYRGVLVCLLVLISS